MAWDALAGQFQRRKEEDNAMGVEKRQVSGGGAPQATATPNQPFTNGQGGSAGAPVSSRFVNFGTLYDANKDKAAGMARGVHDSAQAKADKAKGSLGSAMSQFNAKAQQGTAKGTIGGAHGTRVDNYNPTPATNTTQPFTQARKGEKPLTSGAGPGSVLRGAEYNENGNAIDEDQPTTGSLTQTMEGNATRTGLDPANYSGSGGTMTGGASRYAGLYGPVSTMGSAAGKPAENPDKEALKDYHHSVDLLGAKSGAGQAYTGPGSLKESMGDEGYGQLQDELRKAEEATANLQNAGGIGAALGYGPADPTGLSALDTGLTQVAGQENFKRLGDRTKGLKDTLAAAQADSAKTAAGQGAISEQAAKEWQDLVDEYEAAQTQETAAGSEATPDKPKRAGRYAHAYAEGTNGAELLSSTGYTAEELEDVWGYLTPEERAYLIRGDNVFEDITGYGLSGDGAMLRENIRAKLAQNRTKKQGGG